LNIYLPLVRPGLRLKKNTIEKFLEIICSVFTPGHFRQFFIEEFRNACQFLITLMAHESVRQRIDPYDPFFYGKVADSIRNCGFDDEKLEIARKFFIDLCRLHDPPFIRKLQDYFLKFKCFPLDFILFAIAIEVENGFDALFKAFQDASSNWAFVAPPLRAILKLLPSGPEVPEWARRFLIESASRIPYGQVDEDGTTFACKVVPGMNLVEAKTFLKNLYHGPRLLYHSESIVVSNVFRMFPNDREELLQVFPIHQDEEESESD
jgi:hypothetical protein